MMDDNEECPSNDFTLGTPSGSCWGDGHYRCKECIYYRNDFSIHGQDYIDWVHNYFGSLRIETLTPPSVG